MNKEFHICYCRGRLRLHNAMQHSQKGMWIAQVLFLVRAIWIFFQWCCHLPL